MQISDEMVSYAHVRQLIVSLQDSADDFVHKRAQIGKHKHRQKI